MFLQRLLIVFSLCLVFVFAAATGTAVAAGADSVQLYKKAVSALDDATKKLTANDVAGAKKAVKEANALFAKLQADNPGVLRQKELTPQQQEQWLQNNKMGQDSQAQGEKLERSGQAKLQQSEAMTGQDDVATKLAHEAKRELQLAEKAFIQAQIYHLRNLQMALSSLAQ
jgi:hypothetical protein